MRLFIFLILIVFPGVSQAQTVGLWGPGPVPPKMALSELTVFRAGANNTGVSVVVCPGGSYMYLDIKGEGYDIARWLNSCGITAFVLRYRVGIHGNHYPAMIQDLQRAIQIVRENASEYGIDPEKVGVMGFSAGGHLAGTAATYFDRNFMSGLGVEPRVSLRPAFVAMIYPVVSMEDGVAHRRSRRNLLTHTYSPDLARMMSLELNVREDMPPVFLVQCKGDRTVDYRNATRYKSALDAKGVPSSLVLYDEPGHGFGIDPHRGAGEASGWNRSFIPWLESVTRTGPDERYAIRTDRVIGDI